MCSNWTLLQNNADDSFTCLPSAVCEHNNTSSLLAAVSVTLTTCYSLLRCSLLSAVYLCDFSARLQFIGTDGVIVKQLAVLIPAQDFMKTLPESQ